MNIVHQMQPTPYTCVSTCVAMILGVPAQKIIDKYHDAYFPTNSTLSEVDILAAEGINCFYPDQSRREDRNLNWGNVYILCVPSLNFIGGNHGIVAKLTHDQKMSIYDPGMGRVGEDGKPRKYYVLGQPKNENEVTLNSWHIDVQIPLQKREDQLSVIFIERTLGNV